MPSSSANRKKRLMTILLSVFGALFVILVAIVVVVLVIRARVCYSLTARKKINYIKGGKHGRHCDAGSLYIFLTSIFDSGVFVSFHLKLF